MVYLHAHSLRQQQVSVVALQRQYTLQVRNAVNAESHVAVLDPTK